MAKFDPEDLIKWEELAPSLQKRFTNLEKRVTDLELLLNGVRITIGYTQPLNPIVAKEIFIDLNTNYIYKYDNTVGGTPSWNGVFALRSNLTYNIPTSDVGGNIWID